MLHSILKEFIASENLPLQYDADQGIWTYKGYWIFWINFHDQIVMRGQSTGLTWVDVTDPISFDKLRKHIKEEIACIDSNWRRDAKYLDAQRLDRESNKE